MTVLLQRPVRLSLPQALAGRWLQVMVFVTVAFLVLSSNLPNGERVAPQVAGTYMLIGVFMTICLSLYSGRHDEACCFEGRKNTRRGDSAPAGL